VTIRPRSVEPASLTVVWSAHPRHTSDKNLSSFRWFIVKLEPIQLVGGWQGRVLTEIPSSVQPSSIAPRKVSVDDWRAFLQQLIERPPSLPGYATLKYSKTGEVCRARLIVEGQALEVICKQSRAYGFIERTFAHFRSSRAKLNWERATALLELGISTARPLALLERRKREPAAWLVTEGINDVVDLDQVVLTLLPQVPPDQAARTKRQLIGAIVDFYVRFDRSGLHHRDLKASNLLFTQWDGEDGGPRVWLVDLDGLTRRFFAEKGRRQRLVRLAASLAEYHTVSVSEQVRFLKRYRYQAGLEPSGWKAEWRKLAPSVAAYNRRAKARKRGKIDGYMG
jgi:hypothetical protein